MISSVTLELPVRRWVPDWLGVVSLFAVMLPITMLNGSYTVLTAPYDGYIGRRTLEPGQFVQAGQTISYLVRNRDKYITANYKETQIAHIFIGQEVIVKVDAFRGVGSGAALRPSPRPPGRNTPWCRRTTRPETS